MRLNQDRFNLVFRMLAVVFLDLIEDGVPVGIFKIHKAECSEKLAVARFTQIWTENDRLSASQIIESFMPHTLRPNVTNRQRPRWAKRHRRTQRQRTSDRGQWSGAQTPIKNESKDSQNSSRQRHYIP